MVLRFVVSGTDAADKPLVLAYELKEAEFKVDLHIIPRKALDAEQMEKLQTAWVVGGEFDFPEEAPLVNPNLNAESILPDGIRSDEAGKIRNQQNEWAYRLLTAKLWESFLIELEDLKKRGTALTQYDRKLFDDAKSFWERVLGHRKERDISQDRLDKIKEDVNAIFERLKTFRKTESAEFEAASAKIRDELLAKLEDIKNKAGNKGNFKNLFEEFKSLRTLFHKNRLTRNDDGQLKKAFDSTYQYVEEQRKKYFGDYFETRVKGLNEVIERMEHSLERDRKDLAYFARKAESNNIKSLELQLIKVKTNMLNEAMAGKEVKLKDMKLTLEKLLKQSKKMNKHQDKKVEGEVTPDNASDAGVAAQPDEPNTAGQG